MSVIHTASLLPALHDALLALLRTLTPADWSRPTVAPSWCVRDVVAHLLDVQLRRVSQQRDGFSGPAPEQAIVDHASLVAWLDTLNARWLRGSACISPPLLIDLLAMVGPQCATVLGAIDPDAPALYPVAWAGQSTSPHWMDVGREYTELWHHQQQIRMAVGAPLLEEPRWLHPVLALSVLALRRALAPHARDVGTRVVVQLTGEAGGLWHAERVREAWIVGVGDAPAPVARVVLPATTAWRLWFNAIPREADVFDQTDGDPLLIDAIRGMRSVMV